jgi:hypothetical protein
MVRCSSITLGGGRCKKTTKFGTVCYVHKTPELITCGICLDTIHKGNQFVLQCKHSYCGCCIKEWILQKCKEQSSCPTCRCNVTDYEYNISKSWGLSTGVLYRGNLLEYETSKLPIEDMLYIAVNYKLDCTYTSDEIDIIEKELLENDKRALLKNLRECVSVTPIIIRRKEYPLEQKILYRFI